MPDRLGHRQVGQVSGGLGDNAQARPPGAGGVAGVLTQDGNSAGGGAAQALKDFDGGGLARPIGTQ